MSLFQLCLVIGVFGVGLFLFNQYGTKVDPKAKMIVNFVVILALILICAYAFGLMDVLKGTRVPKL